MKNKRIKSSLCVGVLSLLTVFSAWKTQSLTEISKPYLGEYECQLAQFCNRDLLQDFSFIRLELKEDGTFVLRCAFRDGRTRKEYGKYTYDDEKKLLCLSMGKNGEFKRQIPLEKGVMTINLAFAGKTLQMQFVQK